jgi:signal transduction histidine kinase
MTATDSAKKRRSRRTAERGETVNFTVASALLRELGERLVGQAHIALAELIKNSYDADATVVELTIDEDEIVVSDNGHGMTRKAFTDYWMRIGSPHKEELENSPNGRPLTGSKGVGRLAAQFLAHELQIETSAGQGRELLEAEVDWDEAVDAGELTQARAFIDSSRRKGDFPGGSGHGTRLILRNLKQEWYADALELLGRELWPLRPPFRAAGDEKSAFDIQLSSDLEGAEESFERQMKAILDLWDARVSARLVPLDEDPEGRQGGRRTVQISVEIGGRVENRQLTLKRCKLDRLDYEIRIFDLRYKQPAGIKVGLAREYLNRFGGVHVYDAGFHLPYYGPEADWLGVEMDHSHRVTKSKLLPPELEFANGLEFLPTNSRLWGVVNVNTSRERRVVKKRGVSDRNALTIQVSRDRLVDNLAYKSLRDAVRSGLDLYAMLEARKHGEEIERLRPTEPVPVKAQRIEEVLDRYREDIPPPVFRKLNTQVEDVVRTAEAETQVAAGRAGLLGALATAGISAVAFEHEFSRNLESLERSAKLLQKAVLNEEFDRVDKLATLMLAAVDEARRMRQIFSPMFSEEDRARKIKPRAEPLISGVFEALGPFATDVATRFKGLDEVRLPAGTQAEWSALWQNLAINAINAMTDSPERKILVRHEREGGTDQIFLEDTGAGVDLEAADQLFEPFSRATEAPVGNAGMGFGGTGLGLTIVRMLSETLQCRVEFVAPSSDFSSSARVAWRER